MLPPNDTLISRKNVPEACMLLQHCWFTFMSHQTYSIVSGAMQTVCGVAEDTLHQMVLDNGGDVAAVLASLCDLQSNIGSSASTHNTTTTGELLCVVIRLARFTQGQVLVVAAKVSQIHEKY